MRNDRPTIHAADLFCGAGGTSTGLQQACNEICADLRLTAVNHWPVAIRTHSANHKYAEHICASLDGVDPRKAVPGGHLDILVASPECTHHSMARGGRPLHDQSRASGWHILRWAELLIIDAILIENVPEYRSWGPIGSDGRPLKSRRGETYTAFINALISLGYKVEDRVLNAANYGTCQSRERLFILAVLGRRKIVWPEPTHSETGHDELFGPTKKWRAAKEIIDWSIPTQNIFDRKRPLSPRTMQRITTGLKKFGGVPFLAAVCEPFIQSYYGNGDNTRSVKKPLPTVTTKDRFALIVPKKEGMKLAIGFGMLVPGELAAAQGFPPETAFTGTKSEIVKQIGNAVPVEVAKALCLALLKKHSG